MHGTSVFGSLEYLASFDRIAHIDLPQLFGSETRAKWTQYFPSLQLFKTAVFPPYFRLLSATCRAISTYVHVGRGIQNPRNRCWDLYGIEVLNMKRDREPLTKAIWLQMSEGLYARLKARKRETGCCVAEFVRRCVASHLDFEDKLAATQKGS